MKMINWKFKMSLRGHNRLKLIKTNKDILIELSYNLHRCNEFSYLLFQEKQNDKFKKLSVMLRLKRHKLQNPQQLKNIFTVLESLNET
jgi:hypothetical protein